MHLDSYCSGRIDNHICAFYKAHGLRAPSDRAVNEYGDLNLCFRRLCVLIHPHVWNCEASPCRLNAAYVVRPEVDSAEHIRDTIPQSQLLPETSTSVNLSIPCA